jgi:hypothetical protein
MQSDNSTRPVPTLLIDSQGDLAPAIDIVAGQTHACASLIDNGLVLKCWGGNDAGQSTRHRIDIGIRTRRPIRVWPTTPPHDPAFDSGVHFEDEWDFL